VHTSNLGPYISEKLVPGGSILWGVQI